MPKTKAPTTATEAMFLEYSNYLAKMNYEIARALVTGRIPSGVLRFAEEVYQSQKDIFEPEQD